MIAVTHFGYLVAGYSITFGAIVGYAAWIGFRRRTLARQLADSPAAANENGVPVKEPLAPSGSPS